MRLIVLHSIERENLAEIQMIKNANYQMLFFLMVQKCFQFNQ